MDNLKRLAYISDTLDERLLLEQLAEEASELAHAALKLIRTFKGNKNPTPVPIGEAMDNLREELIDVAMTLLAMDFDLDQLAIDALNAPKWKRWYERVRNPVTAVDDDPHQPVGGVTDDH